MKTNCILNRKLRDLLLIQCKSMHYGDLIKLDIHTSMVIDNGEDIIVFNIYTEQMPMLVDLWLKEQFTDLLMGPLLVL